MKTLITITLLLLSFNGMTSEKKVDTYEEMVKKEEVARQAELKKDFQDNRDTYEADREKEEEREEEDAVFLDEETGPDMTKHIEVKDDAGYDKNNMDKVREAGHRSAALFLASSLLTLTKFFLFTLPLWISRNKIPSAPTIKLIAKTSIIISYIFFIYLLLITYLVDQIRHEVFPMLCDQLLLLYPYCFCHNQHRL